MLNQALSFCLTEDDPTSLVDLLDVLQDDATHKQWNQLQEQKQAFLTFLKNPHHSLEDHQRGISGENRVQLDTSPQRQLNIFDGYEEEAANIISLSRLKQFQTTYLSQNTKHSAYGSDNNRNKKSKIRNASPYQDGWSDRILQDYYNVKTRINSASRGNSAHQKKPLRPQSTKASFRDLKFKPTRYTKNHSKISRTQIISPQQNGLNFYPMGFLPSQDITFDE